MRRFISTTRTTLAASNWRVRGWFDFFRCETGICLPLIYIGGGYPEVDARDLAANESMRSEVHDFARRDGVIYAECGGLMYLCSTLRTLDRLGWPMADVLPGETTMCDRLQSLKYVGVETIGDSILGYSGTHFRGISSAIRISKSNPKLGWDSIFLRVIEIQAGHRG